MQVFIKTLPYFGTLTEIKAVRQILLKIPSIKFHENVLLGAEVFHTKTKETDGYKKLTVDFHNFLKRL